MLLLILGGAVVVLGFTSGLFTTGSPANLPTGAPPAAVDAASQARGFTIGHWPLLVVAGAGAFVAIRFWNKIGGFGRGTLLVVAAACVTGWLATR